MPENQRALENIAESYLEHYRSQDDQLAWAYDKVSELSLELQTGIAVAILLIEMSRSDQELAYVAAGPLEDIVRLHGLNAIKILEEKAANSRKLRFAIAGIWIPDTHVAYSELQRLVHTWGNLPLSPFDDRELH